MNDMQSAMRDPSTESFDTRTLLTNAARQAEQRRYQDFMIVDVDAHHYETDSYSEIVEFVEDPVLRHRARYTKGQSLTANPGAAGVQEMAGRITRYPGRADEKRRIEAPPHRDITMTKRWMDALGVDIACMFPTPMLNLGMHPEVAAEVGLARAYNRWLCERILAGEPRIRSMLYLPRYDAAAALRVVEECGERDGVIGFMVTSARYKPLYDNVYMKLYAALEERGLPLAFHAAFNWNDQMLSQANRFITVHALGFTFFNIIHLTNWIVNGLPERFPKLKTIWVESGLAWLPFVMQRLDNEYMMRSSEAPSLKRLPSEYMRDMFFSSQPMEMVGNREALELTFKMIKADTQLLYSSDYPHWDMDLPSTIYDLPFLSMEAKRGILGENARRLFGLPNFVADHKMKRLAAERSAAE